MGFRVPTSLVCLTMFHLTLSTLLCAPSPGSVQNPSSRERPRERRSLKKPGRSCLGLTKARFPISSGLAAALAVLRFTITFVPYISTNGTLKGVIALHLKVL